ncbi:GNAT family N-acetyltransferase [bacterium]|nr:MAG: GNAT family N-acetyltransferase [bacterium]
MSNFENILIRESVESDIPEILSIQLSAFKVYTDWLKPEQIPPLSETFDDVRKDFNNKHILVAEVKGRIVASVRYEIRSGVCCLEKLSVAPEVQGRGIGRTLVLEVEKEVKDKAHKIYLETGLLAHDLLVFYTRLGYSAEAVLRNHFGGFDWVVFSKFPGE